MAFQVYGHFQLKILELNHWSCYFLIDIFQIGEDIRKSSFLTI